MNGSNSRGKSIRPAVAIAGLALSTLIMMPLFSSPVMAVIGRPPTCYPHRAYCTYCVEREFFKVGGSRCVKCARDPNCRIRMPWTR